VVSSADHEGVVRVAGDLRDDIERVTGVRPVLLQDGVPRQREVAIVGTIGRSPLIDGLIAAGKLDVRGVQGKWETSLQTVVEHPMPGVDRAFVIAGSDQRGTIFGAYDVSRGIGVSPWYWWDDVAPRHRDALYVRRGRHTQGTPAVKYRGIFINDENPALGTWAPAFFGPGKAPGFEGGFNAAFYAKVFEVMLRLKANYLWPAVWGRAFAEDDPLNHATAKAYGIVMGTSHEAPMMRGIEEWNRHAVPAVRDQDGNITTPGHDPYGGTGEWSFRRNKEAVKAYWADGVRRMKDEDFEGVITLGMRGNGDTSLPDGDAIDLMSEIITTQRTIIAEITGKDPATWPQVWTLYKEVQRYWDRGLRVPDDVTVVLTDDNWGNVRKVPSLSTDARDGGYGLYYHFDYVGVGRNYKWVDTTTLPNMWDQLSQSFAYGNDRLWVTNVGDLKGNELPTQFFMDYAWNPRRWELDRLPEWELGYARQNFGEREAAAIAAVLDRYARLQSRRKPELLNRRITLDPAKDLATDDSAVVHDDEATPFSLTDYRELERVTEDWRQLAQEAREIGRRIPAAGQDAWYQLVGYQVEATANVYALREAEFTNLHYAAQGRALTNELAARAQARLADDFALSDRFNNEVAGGKWRGFQTQPHISYGDVARYGPNAPWQQPELNHVALPDEIFPAVKHIELPERPEMGVAVDGSAAWWPNEEQAPATLPVFSPYQSQPAQYIEVFNRGGGSFDYEVRTGAPWLSADPAARPGRDTAAGDPARRLVQGAQGHHPAAGGGPRPRRPHGARRSGDRQSAGVPCAAVRVHRGERLRLHRGRALREGRGQQFGDLAAHPGHRPHRRRHGAVPGDGGASHPGRRSPSPVRADPVHHRPGHRVGVPVAAEQRAGDGRAEVRGVLRRRPAADGEHHEGHRVRRRHHEPPVGAHHLRQRQPHRHRAPDRPRGPPCAPVLDGRPDGGAAETGRRHRRSAAQLSGTAGEHAAALSDAKSPGAVRSRGFLCAVLGVSRRPARRRWRSAACGRGRPSAPGRSGAAVPCAGRRLARWTSRTAARGRPVPRSGAHRRR
jgi:hypothetical protein